MRIFRDSDGTDWAVFEVHRQITAKGEWSHLGGFNDGWLCFESSTAKRRLVSYPGRWREFGDAELEKLLGQARPAPRPAFRLGDDIGDGSASPDIRPD